MQNLDDGVVKALEGLSGVKSVQQFANGTKRLIVESEPREDLMAEMARTVVTKNAGLIRMSPVQLALEEYYLNLIGGRRREQ